MVAFYIPEMIKAPLRRFPGLLRLVAFIRGEPAERRRRAAEARLLPRMLVIEPTNACSLACAKCPHASLNRPDGYLDQDLFKKILGDIRDSGERTDIAFGGSGEPTLHKALVDFVKMARAVPNVGVIGFASSMVNMTPELSERLLRAGLTRLKVSLDADDRETYQKLYRVDAYSTVVENLSNFCEINRRMGEPCTITIKVTLYSDDHGVAERLRKAWSGKVHHVRATGLHNWAGMKGSKKRKARTVPCKVLWEHIQVFWDGQLSLCCFDAFSREFNMGNARDVNLAEYWQRDPALQDVRQLHKSCNFSTLPVCAACNEDEYADVQLDV